MKCETCGIRNVYTKGSQCGVCRGVVKSYSRRPHTTVHRCVCGNKIFNAKKKLCFACEGEAATLAQPQLTVLAHERVSGRLFS